MNNNRRNYYRILQIQPDAPPEIIKNNYRTLLQKLRLHPDLGGENWNASLINLAYNTLRNPAKRAVYDMELLRQHDLTTLSRGHLNNISSLHKPNRSGSLKDKHGNMRNYYRVLHIQPDSPEKIIKSSYRTLLKKNNASKDLLNEAYEVLSDSDARKYYDQLLNWHSHVDTVKMIHNEVGNKINNGTEILKLATHRSRHHVKKAYQINPRLSSLANHLPKSKVAYQPLITQSCAFCKSPHAHNLSSYSTFLCKECNSPLFPPSNTLTAQPRRILNRIEHSGSVFFYKYWPGKKHPASLSDLSPTGMRFTVNKKMDKGQVIKIDGENFKAVGEITYSQHEANEIITGVRFLTIQFEKNKGYFLSART